MSVSDFPQSPTTPHAPPRCIFVTGPRGAGKTRLIQQRLRELTTAAAPRALQPHLTTAVMLAELGRTRAETLAAALPGMALRRLFLPCHCCPELARLPATARALCEANPHLAQIFIETPDAATPRFLEEFDQTLGWPRSLIVCLSPAWTIARRRKLLSPFQQLLIDGASEIIEPSMTNAPMPPVPVLSL